MVNTAHAIDMDKLFRAADYIGRTEDGRRIAGFRAHYKPRFMMETGILCFEETPDGEVMTSDTYVGQFQATPDMVDEIATAIGLEKNQNKDGDITLAACGVSYEKLNEIECDIFIKSAVMNGSIHTAINGLSEWEDVPGDSAYAMLNKLMFARQKLAAVDEALSKMQDKIAEKLEH